MGTQELEWQLQGVGTPFFFHSPLRLAGRSLTLTSSVGRGVVVRILGSEAGRGPPGFSSCKDARFHTYSFGQHSPRMLQNTGLSRHLATGEGGSMLETAFEAMCCEAHS